MRFLWAFCAFFALAMGADDSDSKTMFASEVASDTELNLSSKQRDDKKSGASAKASKPKNKDAPLPNVTPTILAGVVVGLIWIFIFFAGCCCLASVQTNARCVEKGLSMNKVQE